MSDFKKLSAFVNVPTYENEIDKTSRIDTYEMWDDYEGSYDCYYCHECGEYLTDSLQISLYGRDIPEKCPKCGKELRW